MTAVLLLALTGFLQDEKEAESSVSKAIEAHFDRYDSAKRREVAGDLLALWRTLPAAGDLRERGLMRIVRTLETSTHLFPRDQEYRDLRKRHPELPELAVPDRFHTRAYEIAARQLKVLVANAIAFPSRTPEIRTDIADQISEIMDRAVDAFVARAADGEAETLIKETLEARRREFLRAMDDPFAGYLKALEAKPLKDLKDKMVRTAEAMPKLEYDESKAPKDRRGRPVCDIKAFLDAVLVVHDVGRTFNPARFAIYDENSALVAEAQADWKEQTKKSLKAYTQKAAEEQEEK